MCAKQLLVYLSNWILRTLTEAKSVGQPFFGVKNDLHQVAETTT